MAPAAYDGGSEDSSDDDDFNFESAVGSRKFPVHDCCEFEDAESLKVRKFIIVIATTLLTPPRPNSLEPTTLSPGSTYSCAYSCFSDCLVKFLKASFFLHECLKELHHFECKVLALFR